jgi:ABC-type sugar transport system substrate-binding protein
MTSTRIAPRAALLAAACALMAVPTAAATAIGLDQVLATGPDGSLVVCIPPLENSVFISCVWHGQGHALGYYWCFEVLRGTTLYTHGCIVP